MRGLFFSARWPVLSRYMPKALLNQKKDVLGCVGDVHAQFGESFLEIANKLEILDPVLSMACSMAARTSWGREKAMPEGRSSPSLILRQGYCMT